MLLYDRIFLNDQQRENEMNAKNSTNQLAKYSGIGLVVGAVLGMLIGMIFGLEKVGIGLIFGALVGIVFGPAIGMLKNPVRKK